MTLDAFFKEKPCVALAFSGGVDSAYLLYEGLRHNASVRPYFIKTVFQPQFEQDDATRLAKELGVALCIVEVDILSFVDVKSNPINRCYYCKMELFKALKRQALADGIENIIDGTNASDDVGNRPGMRALQELSVRSPLRESGLTKNDIRKYSKEAGLFTWNKPAYACLATRVPTGEILSEKILKKIEKAEGELFKLGFVDFRIRLNCNLAKVQISKRQRSQAIEMKDLIQKCLKPYFENIFMDFESR